MKSFFYSLGAGLVSSASLFAGLKAAPPPAPEPQPCCNVQGEPLKECCPSYNFPGAINPAHKWISWCNPELSMFLDASFLYWYAGEDGLKLASTGVLSDGVLYYNQNVAALEQKFQYQPGFKVGLGIIAEHEWVFHAEYTWFRGSTTTHCRPFSAAPVLTAGIPTATAASGTEVWVVDDWFLQGAGGQALSGTSLASKWRVALDIIDAVGGRPFYQSRRLIVSPYAGLRAAWIRQMMKVQLSEAFGLFGTAFPADTLPPQPIGSRNYSNCWGIGPRVGFNGECLLRMGFRLEGEFAASLLYTKYTSLRHSEDNASTAFNPGPLTSRINYRGCLRPEMDMSLGIGWGSYLCCRSFYLDFSADYDFTIFWAQNMLRAALDSTLTGTASTPSDLFLHGLRITGRFDF